MRKMLALLLTLCMLCSLCTAFAAEITEEGNQSANMTVTYGVDSQYTVVIPETVIIDSNTKTGKANLSISNVMLPSQTVLVIELNSTNAHNDAWYLVNGEQEYEYSIKSSLIGTILPGDYFYCEASLLAGRTMTDTCTFTLVDDVPYAGTFIDIITYTISVVTVKEEHQCYVCNTYFSWECDECASYAECVHVCSECHTCPNCYASDANTNENVYHHCDYCAQCIYVLEEHKWCPDCGACVDAPLFDDDCQRCWAHCTC